MITRRVFIAWAGATIAGAAAGHRPKPKRTVSYYGHGYTGGY